MKANVVQFSPQVTSARRTKEVIHKFDLAASHMSALLREYSSDGQGIAEDHRFDNAWLELLEAIDNEIWPLVFGPR